MAIKMVRLAVLFLFQLSIFPIFGEKAEEENPFADLAGAFLQNLGNQERSGNQGGLDLGAIASLMGGLMQGDASKTNGEDNPGDILSGLGSMLLNQAGNMDPSTLSSIISMVAQATDNSADPDARQKRETQGNNDYDNILNVASTFLNNKNIAQFLPIITNVMRSFSGAETEKVAHEHQGHADFLPPYLERIHLYWDLFSNSELGKTLWKRSGLEKAMKAFKGPDGKISFELMLRNFENHSFRRHWIKTAAMYLTDTVVHMAKPEVYKRYISSAQYLINGYLESQGLPKSAYFDVVKPEKSISALLNHMLRKYLDMDTDVTSYVKPAVDYIKQILKMAQTTGQTLASRGDYHAIADRLTDALNLEVIEPVLRVYRAYRHSLKAPQCQEHLMCLVNRHHDGDKRGLPGFKAGLTKVSSLIASAALSYQHGKGFWDLYNAIQHDVNCEAKYPADCAAFHEHEMKVTTEVYHSEL